MKNFNIGKDVVDYYRNFGYDGSKDEQLIGTYWEYMLDFPMVYFRIDCKRNIDIEFNSVLFKKTDMIAERQRYDEYFINGIKASYIKGINVDSNGVVYERI